MLLGGFAQVKNTLPLTRRHDFVEMESYERGFSLSFYFIRGF